jgi:3-keto-disaccharide hydrolase
LRQTHLILSEVEGSGPTLGYRRLAAAFLLALAGLLAGGPAAAAETFDESGFHPLFDGSSLAGWHASALTSHSAASGQRSGGLWTVEDGAISGTQDLPGNGGILVSDESFGDVEIALEARIDFGVDSGVFLRSTEKGEAYQILVDYYPGGSIGGLYGEALPDPLYIKTFEFLDAGDRIRPLPSFPAPVSAADWPRFWKSDGWNEVRARIAGNPPRVTSWVNGVRFLEFADDRRRLPDRGAIALQVHGGGDHRNQFVRYRNIRVKRLD